MNEPIKDSNSPDIDKNISDALRNLKPRAPQLDWAAIHAAQHSDGSDTAVMANRPLSLLPVARSTVTWLSGIALGAAITFCSMQWFVLNDLRNRIQALEQSLADSSQGSASDHSVVDQTVSGYDNFFDPTDVLDSSNLTPALYRGGRDNRMRPKSIDIPPEFSEKENARELHRPLKKNLEVESDSDMVFEDSVKNQWRLLKEMEPKID
ncbi:MAG: hypothetical protein RLY14_988 [Planctomycetota bacterium]|jgi:hypothetical protein